MAPLKEAGLCEVWVRSLRIHGWEVMAPLEDQLAQKGRHIHALYPWLGSHGSIEGDLGGLLGAKPVEVSMAGKSWLH